MELPNGVEFEFMGPAPDGIGMDPITVEVEAPSGADFRVSWTVQDSDAYDLIEWDAADTAPKDWCQGVFRDFRNSHNGGGEIARDEFYAEMVEAVGADHVFIVDVYAHGSEHFSRANTANYPDRQWDVAPACILAVPPDATNPAEYADGVLDVFSKWANGDVWGVIHNYVKADGTVVDDDSCYGFIGYKCAEKAATSGDY